MNARNVTLAAMVGIMACPAMVSAGSAEDERIRDERRQALFALTDLMLLSRPERRWDGDYEPEPAIDFMLAAALVEPQSAREAYEASKGPGLPGRRRLPNAPQREPAPAVPTLEDKDLNRIDRQILAELDALGQGWSDGSAGNTPPIRSTPDPARHASPPAPTMDYFQDTSRQALALYQAVRATDQANQANWQRVWEQELEFLQQWQHRQQEQLERWETRHPLPPPTPSQPPPPTASKPPAQPVKPGAGSSGGQRSGDRQGGTVKRPDKPPSGGVKSPPPAPQAHRCQKCGKINAGVHYCPKCRLWHCRGE